MHRVGSDFDDFITQFYQNKVRIKYPVYLSMNDVSPQWQKPTTESRILQGAGQNSIFATRYDYLRIGKAILDDWHIVARKYLKTIYDLSVPTGKMSLWKKGRTNDPNFGNVATRYAGQFYSHWANSLSESYCSDGRTVRNYYKSRQSRIVVISAGQEGKYSTKS